MSSRYPEVYAAWKRDPDAFWAEAARAIDWYKTWDKVFDPYAGQYGRWFAGAECNTAYNCLDRHVERGRAGQTALIYDSPVTNAQKSFTYSELTDEVATLGAVLGDMGVKRGDRVVIYMPMIPEAAIAMLACARIGAIHSVVFGGFAAPELAARIEDATPVAVLAASCGIEPGRIVQYKPLLDSAITLSRHKPAKVLMLQRPMAEATMVAGRDQDWASAVAEARRQGRKAGCVSVKATDPLYILYTSGTTGAPKGVVQTQRSLRARWRLQREALGQEAYRRTLFMLPTSFAWGLIGNALHAWTQGAELYVLPPFRSDVLLQLGTLCDELGITYLPTVPAMWRMVLRTVAPPRNGSLRRVACGTSPLPAQLWREIRAWSAACAAGSPCTR